MNNIKRFLAFGLCLLLLFSAMPSMVLGAVELDREEQLATVAIKRLAEVHESQFLRDYNVESINASDLVKNELIHRQDCVNEMAARIGVTFVAASAEIKLFDVGRQADKIYARYLETTYVTYRYPNAESTDQFGFAAEHIVSISNDSVILTDQYSEELATGFNNVPSENLNAAITSEDEFSYDYSSSKKSHATRTVYSAQDAIQYAYQHWNNPDTVNYPGDGIHNDCANFVSQCLHAGGMPFVNVGNYNNGWYVATTPSVSGSLAWVRASEFVTFWNNQGYANASAYGNYTKMGNCIPGNPVYWLNPSGSANSGHIMICTSFNSAGIPCVDAHSSAVHNMPISQYASSGTLYTLKIKTCSHNSYIYEAYNSEYHIKKCTLCSNNLIQDHHWVNHTSYRSCSICGYTQYLV